jgi:hypothetical protein
MKAFQIRPSNQDDRLWSAHLIEGHRNALERSRELKPEIPLYGVDGIRIRDEIELEIVL